MAERNPKKLQVFVSSTFTDLRDERQAAVEAILAAGHIPAGMELFTAGDESQMEVIKQWIDESDVYMLILGARYGSVEPKSGKSYTQLEYEYALDRKKPLFACVMKESITDARVAAKGKEVLELENPQKFKVFHAEVLTRICKFWEDTKDIKLTIFDSLSSYARRDELAGWVRPNTQFNLPALADEIARLSKENAGLRERLLGESMEARYAGLTFFELKTLLEKPNLLGVLVNNRDQLLGLDGMSITEDIHELVARGVAEKLPNGWAGLSADGRAFLNRLNLFEMTEQEKTGEIGERT